MILKLDIERVRTIDEVRDFMAACHHLLCAALTPVDHEASATCRRPSTECFRTHGAGDHCPAVSPVSVAAQTPGARSRPPVAQLGRRHGPQGVCSTAHASWLKPLTPSVPLLARHRWVPQKPPSREVAPDEPPCEVGMHVAGSGDPGDGAQLRPEFGRCRCYPRFQQRERCHPARVPRGPRRPLRPAPTPAPTYPAPHEVPRTPCTPGRRRETRGCLRVAHRAPPSARSGAGIPARRPSLGTPPAFEEFHDCRVDCAHRVRPRVMLQLSAPCKRCHP